ncbi:arginine N-succinyltransferase [Bacteriovorax sp. DB6_IX]|uniref:arginine N-succinyltransferase n=1 Tax=Bacteriovorax sp. DB6_IX TaxID=1353530 RepID=UPI00038A1E22|nr:arginine N-succinyltransferase [Bacteriovorax sp. DB6_IX]EQC52564.1 arginine N-succinyltransferase, alpha or beta subunit [Bacteriovorax sp. DB6_IX]
MFKLRAVQLKDIDDLFELSKLYTFINLPADRDMIEEKVKNSLKTFEKPSDDLAENHYIFVLEDLEKNNVIGCSMIHAQHGTEEEPHFYLTVGQENKFSQSINTGFIHGTLKLGFDTNGPSEIGGLILNPSYRGNPYKLGKQLSFVRFLYMAMHPNKFKELIHTELMPPFDSEGRSPLWEAIGRRFLNMEYHDADLLSRKNKEFILSLFPSGTIYETLLPIEARNAVGKVGKDTLPVKKMIESIGFKYTNEVDPFDGGPHYRCPLKELKPVKNKAIVDISFDELKDEVQWYLVDDTNKIFEAYCVKAKIDNNKLIIDKEFESLFSNSTLNNKTVVPL